MEYFTADWHLGHDNIRRHCARPFTTVEEMDQAIITRCNERVTSQDTLFVLGDITFRASRGLGHYMSQLACKNVYLVFGNHDPQHKFGPYRIVEPDQRILDHFVRVDKAMTIRVFVDGREQHIYLSHFACRTWDKSFHGSWHLYGHSHGKLAETPLSLSMDVGVDAHNFYPLSLSEVAAFMEKKKQTEAVTRQQRIEGGYE